MKNEILVIPDVHGRDFWKEPCREWEGKVIFLGDYHDPYTQQVSKNNSLENLKVLAFLACSILLPNSVSTNLQGHSVLVS